MATFHTVWSIDLGKASLKAVKLRREGNNIEILAVDKIDYPIGTNGVDTAAQSKEALNAFKIRNDVREPVVVAHPGQGTFSRFIKVPAFEAKKLKEMVGYEASQQIPFPLDEVIWDYHLVNRDYLAGEEREVGIFAVRKEAIQKCQEKLALADEIGAECCVNIAGSRSSKWDGPHPDDLTPDTFSAIVDTVQTIIDGVKPKRTYYTLETMPWMYPDSTDSYVKLIDAIDRPSFAVHFDPVNLICSPQRYFNNAALMESSSPCLARVLRACMPRISSCRTI